MSSVVISRGRGRGRGLSKGWLGNFKPNPCLVKEEDIARYEDAEEKEINSFVIDDNNGDTMHNSIDEISEKIAHSILSDKDGKDVLNKNIHSAVKPDEKPADVVKVVPVTSATQVDIMKSKTPQPVVSATLEEVMKSKTPHPVVSTTQEEVMKSKTPQSVVSATQEEVMKPNTAPVRLDSVLLNVIDVQEFIPKSFAPSEEKERKLSITAIISPPLEGRPPLLRTPSTGEDQVAIDVLKDVIMSLMEDPGDYTNVIDQLTEHLMYFVTKEETLHEVVNVIIKQAIDEPNFRYSAAKMSQHFDQRKVFELDNGTTFRKVFFKRCQEQFKQASNLLKDSLNDEDIARVTNIALLFGELFCNMKLKDKPNPLYRKVILDFVNMFLEAATKDLIICLTRLLKLSGPELDIDRPKDVEIIFEKIKDFCLEKNRYGHIPDGVKTSLWNVYKLRSRDWDRSNSVPTSPSSENMKFNLPVAAHAQIPMHEQSLVYHSLQRKRSSSDKDSGPIDWNEYYTGDDTDIYKNYMNYDGEIDDYGDGVDEAFEEFLQASGQI